MTAARKPGDRVARAAAVAPNQPTTAGASAARAAARPRPRPAARGSLCPFHEAIWTPRLDARAYPTARRRPRASLRDSLAVASWAARHGGGETLRRGGVRR